MITDTRDEITDGPKRCAENIENVKKLTVKVFTKLNEIQNQLDTVKRSIQENIRTKENPDGYLLGKVEIYTSGLEVKQETMRQQFVED